MASEDECILLLFTGDLCVVSTKALCSDSARLSVRPGRVFSCRSVVSSIQPIRAEWPDRYRRSAELRASRSLRLPRGEGRSSSALRSGCSRLSRAPASLARATSGCSAWTTPSCSSSSARQLWRERGGRAVRRAPSIREETGCCDDASLTPSWSRRLWMLSVSAGTTSSSLSRPSLLLTWLSASSRPRSTTSTAFNLEEAGDAGGRRLLFEEGDAAPRDVAQAGAHGVQLRLQLLQDDVERGVIRVALKLTSCSAIWTLLSAPSPSDSRLGGGVWIPLIRRCSASFRRRVFTVFPRLLRLLLHLPPLARREGGALFAVGQEVGELGLQVVQDLLPLRRGLAAHLTGETREGAMRRRRGRGRRRRRRRRKVPPHRVQAPAGDGPDVFEQRWGAPSCAAPHLPAVSVASWLGGGTVKHTEGTMASLPVGLITFHLVLWELSSSTHSSPRAMVI
ncbi:hypothetical protein EYF80_039020 [Liparis tanakae]|uniref:Uncharacterized protein n=1 Tax=Liparis tanakae TaxID=230148 RepID=A0A4Z2GB38_9TELE|nr:hypothetical protein EYF80_039020 [Liparis tanakae]